MTYKWNYLTLTTDQKNKKNELTKEIQIDPVLTELLLKRGISSVGEAQKFLYPSLSDLHDPFLLPDMEEAIRRIEQAIGNKERILIYGDYDVDGTTAVSLAAISRTDSTRSITSTTFCRRGRSNASASSVKF